MSENMVARYGWTKQEAPQSCGYIAPNVLSVIKSLGGQSVLDIGSGNGALCGMLAKEGYRTVGMEYDEEGVSLAKMSYPAIPFYKGGVQDNPAEVLSCEAPFDIVVSTEVVEHLFAPHQLPRFASSILKRDGYMIISTPYHGYMKNCMISFFGKWDKHHTALWDGGHIKFWSYSTLSALLTSNGFNVVGFSGVGRFPYMWKSMIVVAQKIA